MSESPHTPPRSELSEDQPSRARLGVLGFLGTMSFVLYLDRICIAQALPAIQKQFTISDTHASFILMAFTLAYGLFEVPTGHWGDRYGSRRVLTRIVVWWSIFTALTGACVGYYSLLVVRFLFGAGEAGAYPNAARVIARWFPAPERGRVQAFFQATSLIGGAVSPLVAGVLIELTGWRVPFFLFGAFGVVWALAFYAWFRDDPAEHPRVNKAEAKLLADGALAKSSPDSSADGDSATHAVPWGEVARHRTIWALSMAVSCSAFNTYFYFSWYPKYLQAARDVPQAESGMLASLVLAGGTIGTLLGGQFVDRVIRRSPRSLTIRRIFAVSVLLIAAALLLASKAMDNARVSAVLASLSCFALLSQQPIWWTCATEVSGRYIGALFGLMNGMGVFGAMGSQLFFGVFADWRKEQGFTGREQYDPAFYVFAAVLLVGASCWALIDPRRAIGERKRLLRGPDDP